MDTSRLLDEIRETLSIDTFANTIRDNPKEYSKFSDENGLLMFEGRIYVPTTMR